MATYSWSKGLIKQFSLDPYFGKDFGQAEMISEEEDLEQSPNFRTILRENRLFFNSNPFIKKRLTFADNPDLTFLPTIESRLKISTEEALRKTYAFYNSTDGEIYSVFKPIFNKRFENLMAIPITSRQKNSIFSGHCYSSQRVRASLISFYETNNFEMLGVIIHEYAHAIAFAMRNYMYTNDCNSVFDEIESRFIELIAYDWLKKNTNLQAEANNELCVLYNDILNSACRTLETSYVCDMVQKMRANHQKITMRNIMAQADIEFETMPKSYLKGILKELIKIEIEYGYSGLIAVELYQIYLQDPKAALDLYKRIIRINKKTAIKTNANIEQLGIIAGEHFEDFGKSLKR